MAIPRSAQVAGVRRTGTDTVLLDLSSADPLGFAGGQYIIVDSGRVLPNGKAVKRAYSVLSADDEQLDFQLAVARIPGGPGSDFMHELKPGAEIRFSGPWGKFFPQGDSTGPILVLATDTGITAVLGLVQSVRFRPLLDRAMLLWLRTSPEYFLPETFVRQRLAPTRAELRVEELPPVGHPERIAHTCATVRDCLANRQPGQAFIAGDGALHLPLLDYLVAAGLPAAQSYVEAFFNAPRKSA